MINILIFSALIFATGLTFYFIYQNVYGTLANARAIITLKSNPALFDLDLSAYEKARIAIAQKKEPNTFPANMRNIFTYVQTNTSTYVNTSTPL